MIMDPAYVRPLPTRKELRVWRLQEAGCFFYALAAHRFRHHGEPLTYVDQLLDSVNYPRHALIAELWAPVGLRFHALHHLFPALPYHALAEAHRRLMERLPADSPYRQTESP